MLPLASTFNNTVLYVDYLGRTMVVLNLTAPIAKYRARTVFVGLVLKFLLVSTFRRMLGQPAKRKSRGEKPSHMFALQS